MKRYVTLSFDDGFRESSLKTAALFEQFGLKAEMNIVAAFHDRDPASFGDWGLWNELVARGHSIQPHGYNHTDKSAVPRREARDLILRCLDLFETNLRGFAAGQAILAMPYNRSTPELEAWMATVVRAFRTEPGPAINPLPTARTARLGTAGSEHAEELLDRLVGDLLARDEGWLVYCAHGLDGEGWGPLRSSYLEALLERLTQTPGVEILPARDVLARADGAHV